METFRMERVGSITGTLLFMEVVVLDKGLYPIFLHEPVIFFRAVTGVCHIWGIERSGFFNGQGKWAKGFENQMV